MRNFIEKVIEFYHSLDVKYTKQNLQLVGKDVSRSCRSLIETLRNILSRPVIEFEIALLSVVRQSRSRLVKELDRLKHFAVNIKSELITSAKIGEVKSLKLSPRKLKLPSESKIVENASPRADSQRNLKEIATKSTPNLNGSHRLQKILRASGSKASVQDSKNINSIVENAASEFKDQTLNSNEMLITPHKRNTSLFFNSSQLNEASSMKPGGTAAVGSLEKLDQPYEHMGIDLFQLKSTYKGTKQIDKYFSEIDELIERANKGTTNSNYFRQNSLAEGLRKENKTRKSSSPEVRLNFLYDNLSRRKTINEQARKFEGLTPTQQIQALSHRNIKSVVDPNKAGDAYQFIGKDELIPSSRTPKMLFGGQNIASPRLPSLNLFNKLPMEQMKAGLSPSIKHLDSGISYNLQRRRGTEGAGALNNSRVGTFHTQISPKNGMLSPKGSVLISKIQREAALNTKNTLEIKSKFQ